MVRIVLMFLVGTAHAAADPLSPYLRVFPIVIGVCGAASFVLVVYALIRYGTRAISGIASMIWMSICFYGAFSVLENHNAVGGEYVFMNAPNRHWPSTKGKIVNTQVMAVRSKRRGSQFVFRVRSRYRVKGLPYESKDDMWVGRKPPEKKDLRLLQKAYSRNEVIQIYFDPSDPSHSQAERDKNAPDGQQMTRMLATAVFLFIMGLIPVVLWNISLFRKRLRRPRPRRL